MINHAVYLDLISYNIMVTRLLCISIAGNEMEINSWLWSFLISVAFLLQQHSNWNKFLDGAPFKLEQISKLGMFQIGTILYLD